MNAQLARLIIEVRGGVAQPTASTFPLEVLVVDWDNLNAGEPLPSPLCLAPMTYDQFEAALETIRLEANPK